MATHHRSPIEPFTWDAYASYLSAASGAGYSFLEFQRFREVDAWPSEPFILLRHDIDYDPSHIAAICRIEAEQGVAATYFVMTDSPFYDTGDAGVEKVIRESLKQGHKLGLHFDANKFLGDQEVLEQVEIDAKALETKFETPVSAVSFHMPARRPVGHLCLANGRVNTYGPKIFNEIEYCSDSNQNWRGKDVVEILTKHRPAALQLVTHPIWWRERFTPFLKIMQEFAEKKGVPLSEIITAEQRALYRNLDSIE